MKKLILLALMACFCIGAQAQATLNSNSGGVDFVCKLSVLRTPAANSSAVSLQKFYSDKYEDEYFINIATCNSLDRDATCYLGTKKDAADLLRSLIKALDDKEVGSFMTITDNYGQTFNITIYRDAINIQPGSDYGHIVVEDTYSLMTRKLVNKAIELLEAEE